MLRSPFIFFNITIVIVFIYFLLFGLIFKFGHSFNSFRFFPLILVTHVIIAFLFYAFSIKNFVASPNKETFLSIKKTLIIFSLFLLISCIFPASALFGMYPADMGIFHIILLYFISISFLSMSTIIFFMSIIGISKFNSSNKFLMMGSITASFLVCIVCMILFNQLKII